TYAEAPGSVRSVAKISERVPCDFSSSDASCRSLSALRATRTRLYPSRAKMRANSIPIPNEAPVISAVLRSSMGATVQPKRSCHKQRRVRRPASASKKRFRLHMRQRRLHSVDRVPRSCGFQAIVHVIDVLYAFIFQPLPESIRAVFRVDGDAFLPRGASAEHAVEFHARLGCQLQRLGKLGIAHAR